MRIRLRKKKEAWILTIWGWLAIIIIFVLLVIGLSRGLGDYLRVERPVKAKVLVVEGFLPDYALLIACKEFEENHYDYIITTGLPFSNGMEFCLYKNYADLARAVLIRMGIDSNRVFSVPSPEAFIDRTYQNALAVGKWLKQKKERPSAVNLFSMGAHARRSWFLYRMALEPYNINVGIIAAPDLTFDQHRWWKSSKGFRTVPVEALGYFYVRFFFHPAN